jgi:hypothetical protein
VRSGNRTKVVYAALSIALALTACNGSGEAADLEPPATKEPIQGTELYTVYLTEKAAERIDVKTTEVIEAEGSLAVPSAALIVDPTGTFWVYVTDEPFAYHRVEVGPVRETEGWAYFSEGPGPGTRVVIEGVPELYGEDTGVGK